MLKFVVCAYDSVMQITSLINGAYGSIFHSMSTGEYENTVTGITSDMKLIMLTPHLITKATFIIGYCKHLVSHMD
jgi:hypothetical protein